MMHWVFLHAVIFELLWGCLSLLCSLTIFFCLFFTFFVGIKHLLMIVVFLSSIMTFALLLLSCHLVFCEYLLHILCRFFGTFCWLNIIFLWLRFIFMCFYVFDLNLFVHLCHSHLCSVALFASFASFVCLYSFCSLSFASLWTSCVHCAKVLVSMWLFNLMLGRHCVCGRKTDYVNDSIVSLNILMCFVI